MLAEFHRCENFSEISNHLLTVLGVFKLLSFNSSIIVSVTLSTILATDRLLIQNWYSKERKVSPLVTIARISSIARWA